MPIRRLKAGQQRQFVLLSAALWGVWTHWNGVATEGCFCEKKHCQGCKKGLPKRWKTYLHSWDLDAREECFLELTPRAADSLLGQLGEAAPLRGNRIVVVRGGGDKARLRITVLTAVREMHGYPAEKDPESTLKKIWGMEDPIAFTQQPTTLPLTDAI